MWDPAQRNICARWGTFLLHSHLYPRTYNQNLTSGFHVLTVERKNWGEQQGRHSRDRSARCTAQISVVENDNTPLQCGTDCLRPVTHVQLGKDADGVIPNGIFAIAEYTRNFSIGEPGNHT
jgi:hypothetical protein